MRVPTRPALRYFGGKWKMAAWVAQHFPAHRTYLEPFGGAASVLIRKPRSHAEVYNDLDGDLVNLFRILRDRMQAAHLIGLLRLTPFARDELLAAYEVSDDPMERARRLIVRSFQGFGSNPTRPAPRTGFRSTLSRSGTTPASDWASYPDALPAIVERMQGVSIENRPALKLITQFDRDDCLIYADPPYVHATRPSFLERGQRSDGYIHELTDDEHRALLDTLSGSAAMVALSGYKNEIYSRHLSDWTRVDRSTHSDAGRERTESLWLNPLASSRLAANLFASVAA